MTKKQWTIIGVLGVFVVCVFASLILLVLNLLWTKPPAPTSAKSQEVVKAEQLLPANTPNRGLLLSEVEKGYLSALDIEVYLYMQERFAYHEKIDGKYIISKHEPLVLEETQRHFNMSEGEVDRRYSSVAWLMAGVKPKEEIQLDEKSIPVIISVDKVELSAKNELLVTATNSTNLDQALPTINMRFNLYSGNTKVTYQIVWAENFKKGTSTFKSLPISAKFDSVDCTAYINIDNMKSYNLKSIVQVSNDRGETVIPIYIMPKTRVK